MLSKRYQILDQIGAGNMGTVHRALDRLTGQTIALKRVKIPLDQLEYGSRADGYDLALTLAQEFKILASLRHPNIISVLDYGFDEHRQPYITMELLEGADTVYNAGRGQPDTVKINLLAQTLRALMYLHRRGLLHRDLKPRNVLVVDGQVKLLDFGLSVMGAQAQAGEVAGTPSYMAPEIWNGARATKSSDIYSFGIIAYELFAEQRPFDTSDLKKLYRDVQSKMPDFSKVPVNDNLRMVLQRMLLKDADSRYQDAADAMAEFRAAVEVNLPEETRATRESFLQAATFVGRDIELAELSHVLNESMTGKGSGWLVAGESGVGKSRLLDELRTLGLVEGVLVLRGQAVGEGGRPYAVWRDVLRWLCLTTDLEQREASVLKAVVPDIAKLIGRDVPDAPQVSAQADQTRLIKVVESMFRAQTQPVLVILEDLHWAGDESLALLARISQIAPQLPVMIVGSYRDDESPHLPVLLPNMHVLTLSRLSAEGTAELVEAMLGPVGTQPQLLSLLQRETEGNIFFLVEVVRALAEEAGQMNQIGASPLPRQVLTGGVEGVIRRRLSRIPETARGFVEVAAIVGRQLDMDVIREVLGVGSKDRRIDEWLTDCADAAVLEVRDNTWQFTHNKLRDGVIHSLSTNGRQTLHRKVAQAIEVVYEYSKKATAAMLAYHWRMAEDLVKEEHYSALAGEQALRSGAYASSLAFLKRALDLQEVVSSPKRKQANLMHQMGETYYEQGLFEEARQAFHESLMLYTLASYQWGIATSLNSLGNTLTEQGDFEGAAQHYLDALKTAMEIRAIPVALSVLAGMAKLLAKAGDKQVALEYLALVLHHPAADAQAHYVSERVLTQLRFDLPADVIAQALEEGKQKNLRDVVAQILGA